MDDCGFVRPYITRLGETYCRLAAFNDRFQLRFRYPAKHVTARHDPQWSVIYNNIVEVDSQGDQRLDDRLRRLDVKHAVLGRPRAEAISFDFRRDRNSTILMPVE